DALEALVVAPGEDVGRVVGQAEDADALLRVVVEIFATERALADVFAKVRRVGTAAAVAAHEDESALAIGVVHHVSQSLYFTGVEPPQFLADALEKGARVEFGSEHTKFLRAGSPRLL